jgi:hypothetical protein
MPQTYDGNNRVTIGDPTEKADYDQLLNNNNSLRVISGRQLASGGSDAAVIDSLTYIRLPNSFEFVLPARDDVGGLIIRVAGYMSLINTVVAGDNVSVRLELWDGIAWVGVANSELVFNTTILTYLESVNIQANLFSIETRYRFAAKVATSTNQGVGFAHVSQS